MWEGEEEGGVDLYGGVRVFGGSVGWEVMFVGGVRDGVEVVLGIVVEKVWEDGEGVGFKEEVGV